MRTLFISDIHGQLVALKALLADVCYDPGRDRLILLGDYVGANSDSVACILYVWELVKRENVVALLGNHDLALWRCLKNQEYGSGKPYTYTRSLATQLLQGCPGIEQFFEGLKLWFDNAEIIAVHAGFNPVLHDWRQSSIEEFTTIRQPFLSASLGVSQTVVFGHTPCVKLHDSPNIWYGPGRIGIDGGAGKGLQLNCLIYDEAGFSSVSVVCD